MSSLITDEIRAKASEMYRGDSICQVKSRFLLTEMGLPNGLLPLKDIIEVGYVKETGFVWLIQKKKCDHRFEKINRPVQYATEVTAYVEPNKIKKLTGVKTKEMFVWVTLSEIYVDDPPTGKITFKTPSGLSRSFPVEAFQIEVNDDEVKTKEMVIEGKDDGVVKVDKGGDVAVGKKEEVKVGENGDVEVDKEEVKVFNGANSNVVEVKVGESGDVEVGKEEVKVFNGANSNVVEVKEV